MVYPTLLAAIGDVAHPVWRASAVGVYRLWRDLGYAIGALVAGFTADVLGIHAAIWLVAAMTFASGLVVALRMSETMGINATRFGDSGVSDIIGSTSPLDRNPDRQK
jgi:MFS family permease